MSSRSLKELASLFEILRDPTRLDILMLLWRAGGARTLTRICIALGKDPADMKSQVHYHLKRLVEVKLVRVGEEGAYELTDRGREVAEFIMGLMSKAYPLMLTDAYGIARPLSRDYIRDLVTQAGLTGKNAQMVTLRVLDIIYSSGLEEIDWDSLTSLISSAMIENGFSVSPAYAVKIPTEELRRALAPHPYHSVKSAVYEVGRRLLERVNLLEMPEKLKRHVRDGVLSVWPLFNINRGYGIICVEPQDFNDVTPFSRLVDYASVLHIRVREVSNPGEFLAFLKSLDAIAPTCGFACVELSNDVVDEMLKYGAFREFLGSLYEHTGLCLFLPADSGSVAENMPWILNGIVNGANVVFMLQRDSCLGNNVCIRRVFGVNLPLVYFKVGKSVEMFRNYIMDIVEDIRSFTETAKLPATAKLGGVEERVGVCFLGIELIARMLGGENDNDVAMAVQNFYKFAGELVQGEEFIILKTFPDDKPYMAVKYAFESREWRSARRSLTLLFNTASPIALTVAERSLDSYLRLEATVGSCTELSITPVYVTSGVLHAQLVRGMLCACREIGLKAVVLAPDITSCKRCGNIMSGLTRICSVCGSSEVIEWGKPYGCCSLPLSSLNALAYKEYRERRRYEPSELQQLVSNV